MIPAYSTDHTQRRFACARGFARGLVTAEGGSVAPVSLVSVHP